MTTKKQTVANRKNAKKGGVRTAAGKQISRFNAQKHGILSLGLTEHEEDLKEKYLTQFFDDFKPANIAEEVLVERMCLHYLRMMTIRKAEIDFFDLVAEKQINGISFVGEYAGDFGYKNIKTLSDIYQRYETSTENRFYKALHELERLQRMRKGEKLKAPEVIEA